MWKDFFYFTRAERQGILILAVLCILVFVAGWLIPVKENTAKNDTEKFKKEYAGFMSSIREKEQDAITGYRGLICKTYDNNIIDIIKRIIMDEKVHKEIFEDILNNYSK